MYSTRIANTFGSVNREYRCQCGECDKAAVGGDAEGWALSQEAADAIAVKLGWKTVPGRMGLHCGQCAWELSADYDD